MPHLNDRASAVVYTIDTSGLQTLGVTAAQSPASARLISDNLGSMQSSSQSRNPSSTDRTTLGNPEAGLRALDNLATARRGTYFESQGVLKYLAELTGGIAIKNTNDVGGSLGRILEDILIALASNRPLDPKQILADTSKIRRFAGALKTQLSLPAPEDDKTNKGQLRFQGPLRATLLQLDAFIASFVNNPIFKTTVHIVDAHHSVQARRDLDSIIDLSDKIKKATTQPQK